MEDHKARLEKLLNAESYTEEDRKWMLDYLNNTDLSELRLLGFNQFNTNFEEAKNILERRVSESILQGVHNQINIKPTVKPLYASKWFAAASVLLVMFSIGLYLYSGKQKLTVAEKSNTQLNPDIEPGGNKAVLVLADGSKITLDNAQNGVLTSEGNTTITKSRNGQLIYNAAGATGNRTALFNTVTTPRAGQYQIILPDGTKVWLNSASSLRFPAIFSGRQRKVELTGEAYFEVAKNKAVPFVVSSGSQTIEVLGTHFNVNAYHDEASIKTTLLEGSVKVTNASSNVLLSPGQQSLVSNEKGSAISVVAAESDEAIAWKNGYFLFNDEELTSIMREISRWYDIDVVYQGDVNKMRFGGMVSRSKNISSVLKIMELTKRVHFKIIPADAAGKGRRILVMP